jgi:hypothetical protein
METQYGSLREKIRAEKTQRIERNAAFDTLWREACTAAHSAAQIVGVKPMTVVGYNPSTGERTQYFVEGGVCGFAYIKIAPATCAFARYLKARGIGHKSYYGGWEVSIPHFGQSMQRKEEYARVVAERLKSAGIQATHYSRMD